MQDIINDIKRTSEVIRRCQRNWDHSKSIPREHIELLAEVAKNSPAKQDEAYFDVYAITDRDLIEKLYENSDGFTSGALSDGKLDNFKVSWNFNKFLVDENGKLVSHYGSSVSPLSEDITKHLK